MGSLRRRDRWNHRQKVVDALHRGLGALNQAHHPSDAGNGPGQKAHVVHKFRDDTGAEATLDNALTADPHRQYSTESHKHHHERREQGIDAVKPAVERIALGRALGVALGLLRFKAVDFEHADSAKGLLGERTNGGLLLLDGVASLVNERRNPINGPYKHGHRSQCDPAQLRVHLKHKHQGESRRKGRVNGVHDPWAEVHAHAADVFADAVHQVARGVAAVKRLVKRLVVVVDVVFEVKFNAARHDNQGLAHEKGKGSAQGTQQQNQGGISEERAHQV